MEKVLDLLNQIIEKNLWEDRLSKKSEETGESWNVFHLKVLKKMLEDLNAKN